MLAMPFSVLMALMLMGIGVPLVHGLDRERRLGDAERLVCAFLTGTLVLHFAVQAVGHLRLDRISMGGLGLVLLAMAVPGLKAVPWAGLWDGAKSLPRLPLLLLLGVCLLAFLQGLAPPNDYDSLMYHLAVPKADLERGVIAPDWMRALPSTFFPHLVTSQIRFALAIAGEAAAQPAVALMGLAATAATGLLARRVGCSAGASLWAALLFAAVRLNVWEMGTVEVDLPLSAAAAAAALVFLAGRQTEDWRLMVLLGLLFGIGFNIKYQGGLVALCFAPLLLLAWLRGPVRFTGLLAMGTTAMAVFVPHLLENYLLTGDPLFPLYFSKMFPGGAPFYDDYNLTYGTGRGLADFLIEPWLMFAAPMQHFDGMVLGAPYLLALMPGAVIGWRRLQGAAALMAVTSIYYALWFTLQSQQLRFLSPVLPIASVLAAAGGAFLWEASRKRPLLKGLALLLMTGLFVNQSLFVGIYAALRLPVALGLMSPADYHAKTPTLQGAFYPTCRYISERLKPGEHYLSLLIPHSYYCPQEPAVRKVFADEKTNWLWADPPHKIGFADFVARAQDLNFRFVIVPVEGENRRNETGESVPVAVQFASFRFGPFIEPALRGLDPVASEPRSAVYDGQQVLANLQRLLKGGSFPQEMR